MNLHDLRDYILLIAGRMVKWSTVSSLTSNFGGLNATMPPVDPALGDKSTTQTCRNMIGFGFRSAPVTGSECIVTAPRAGAVNATVVASDHLGYGPTDLAEGDSVQYSKAHHEGVVAIVRVYADGNIRIQTSKDACHVVAKPGSGGKVKLGDDVDASLDPVALYTQLKADFDAFVGKYNGHAHLAGSLLDSLGFPVTGATASVAAGSQAANLSASVQSANVVAKKS